MSEVAHPNFRPYLIQRGKTKTEMADNVTNLTSLVDLNYMGSSEFEWGAIPKALKLICAMRPSLEITPTNIRLRDGRVLHMICPPSLAPQLQKFLEEEYRGVHHHLKESTYLDYVDKKPNEMMASLGQSVNFWWDIENAWMATLGKHTAELVLLALDGVKRQKGW